MAGSAACATKKYVETTAGSVEQQLTPLSNAIEEAQEQTRKNDARISDLDSTVQNLRETTERIHQAATEAAGFARLADSRVEVMERSSRRLVYELVLRQDDVTFGFEDTELSDAARNELTALVEKLKRETSEIVIVLEGHTDSAGSETVNERIGLERAEAVERYLYEEHHIPLQKMDVISYGEDKPVAPNTTREGRAQNRRVVIKVMA